MNSQAVGSPRDNLTGQDDAVIIRTEVLSVSVHQLHARHVASPAHQSPVACFHIILEQKQK